MSFSLYRFSDFVRKKIFEANSSQKSSSTTTNQFFSNHYLERAAGYFDLPKVEAGLSRVIPADEKNKDGFVLTQNLLDENGSLIKNVTLSTILQNFAWNFEDLKKELSKILTRLAKSPNVQQFLIQANSNSLLEKQWVMFLGKVCLLKSGQKFYLDFRSAKFQHHIGGTLWASGSDFNPGAKTILIYKIGKNGDFDYDQWIKNQVAKAEIPKKFGARIEMQLTNDQINQVQLLYPYGQNFTLEIDLDLSIYDILKSISDQINLSQAVTPVLNKKPKSSPEEPDQAFVPENIFNFFKKGYIWFSNDNLYFRNENIWDILDAIEKGEIKTWDFNKNEYSAPNNTTFIYKAKDQDEIRKKIEKLFTQFHSENSKYSSISNTKLEDEDFKKAFQNLKSNFDKFKRKSGKKKFSDMNSEMDKKIKSLQETKTNILSFHEFLAEKKGSKSGKNPCWSGYRQVGTKTKNGRLVPNCVPIGKSKTSLKENDEIEDMISGFEDLGINEKPKVWFIDWESCEDGRYRNLWIVEGYTRPEVILKIAETLNLEDGLDQEDWENFLNLVKEDEHGIWGELVQLAHESNYRGGEENLLGVNVMDHPKPSAIHLEPRSLTLYGEYNSSPENARLVRGADQNLKSWFGLGLDSIEGLKSDHWI